MKKVMIFGFVLLFLCPLVLGESYLLKQVIEEGETQIVTINGWDYEVELVMVSDQARKAIFKVNGEKSSIMSEGDSDKFSDGTSLLAREILIQEGGDGRDIVQYNIYAGKKAPAPVVAEVVEEKVEPAAMPEPVVADEETIKEEPEAQEEKDSEVTRIVVKKKGLWGRFVDWLRGVF